MESSVSKSSSSTLQTVAAAATATTDATTAAATAVVQLPDNDTTMRAAQGKNYGPVDEMLTVEDGVRRPCLSDLKPKNRKDMMLVRVQSVALAPGDCRVLSGLTRELQGPPYFPYVPGGDCSGIVVELPPSSSPSSSEEDDPRVPFKVGDRVACRFRGKPLGALGEYAMVSAITAAKIPSGLTCEDGACLASASPAVVLADRLMQSRVGLGRVLLLGASGGIGAHLVQLLKDKDDDPGGAGGDVSSTTTYVVGVTSRPDQLQPFVETGVLDEVIDYTKDDVFSLEKFRKADSKFDLVVDLAGCGYRRLEQMYGMGETLPVKAASDGGRFVTFVPPVGPIYEVHGVWTLLRTFLFPLLWKALTSRTLYRKSLPSYTFALALPDSRECVVRALELAGSGRLKPVVDGRGPHPFTTEGVREAFRIQQSRHATGKTLIRVSALDEDAAFSGFDGATT